MRNYWLRIILGAVAIFTVGMVGITLARQGIGRVRGVVGGSGPIVLPVAFIPFKLDGQKLGTVSKVVLERDAPKEIAGVELEVKLSDSAVARGLEGCRLAANLDKDADTNATDNIRVGPLSRGVFTCLHENDTTPGFEEFGRAIFQPGDVIVPLLLPEDIVDDLRQGHFGSAEDSISAVAEAQADSIAEIAEAHADSVSAAQQKQATKDLARHTRFLDSLRREGFRRADSTRRADSLEDAPGPR